MMVTLGISSDSFNDALYKALLKRIYEKRLSGSAWVKHNRTEIDSGFPDGSGPRFRRFAAIDDQCSIGRNAGGNLTSQRFMRIEREPTTASRSKIISDIKARRVWYPWDSKGQWIGRSYLPMHQASWDPRARADCRKPLLYMLNNRRGECARRTIRLCDRWRRPFSESDA